MSLRTTVLFSCPMAATSRRLHSSRLQWAGVWLLAGGMALTMPWARAQPGKTSPNEPHGEAPVSSSGKAAAPIRPGPLWTELPASQQAVLKPLNGLWDSLSESQKRKWIEVSHNYANLPPAEQQTMHGRMTGWAALSSRQRVQARLNFAEVKQLAPSEHKAMWEAYQALSEDDKRTLADKAPMRPKSAAIPVRPVPVQKLVQVPAALPKGEHGAKIMLASPAVGLTPSVAPTAPVAPLPAAALVPTAP